MKKIKAIILNIWILRHNHKPQGFQETYRESSARSSGLSFFQCHFYGGIKNLNISDRLAEMFTEEEEICWTVRKGRENEQNAT